jgi:5,10-methylenetetrahydromethanopterin reductase
MAMRIGVAFDGFVTTSEAITLAKHAVDAGAKSLWVAEHLGYREAITTCAAFALSAPGPTLVPTAVSPYLWHATPTAMALATLDELAPGRVAVALGVGNPLFLQESGQKLEKPIRVMREFIAAMRQLWTTEPAHMDGEFVKLAGARLAFKPNPIPIYVAAMGPDMLHLTGRIADGVVLSAGLSTDSVRKSLARCAEGAGKEGRDPKTLRRAGYMFFGSSNDARWCPTRRSRRSRSPARPSTACGGCAISSMPGSMSRCSAWSARPPCAPSASTSCASLRQATDD